MTQRKLTILFLAVGCLALLASAQGKPDDAKYDVPELEAFHEVIYPIWHTAYPKKDAVALRRFVPEVDRLAEAVGNARLPGILKERQDKWAAGLALFRKAVEGYDRAARGQSDQALLDAAEELHTDYEKLVRIVRPLPPEVMDFHGSLYVIYHTLLPAKDWAAIRAAVPGLAAQAEALGRAILSKRFEGRKEKYEAAAAALLASVKSLGAVPPGRDADLGPAVARVHSRYQDLERVFD